MMSDETIVHAVATGSAGIRRHRGAGGLACATGEGSLANLAWAEDRHNRELPEQGREHS
jgi:hypothetical protein